MYDIVITIRHRQSDSYSSIFSIIINAQMWMLISVLLPQVELPLIEEAWSEF
jgi:hypothetical protein